jgi:hypothetical protein
MAKKNKHQVTAPVSVTRIEAESSIKTNTSKSGNPAADLPFGRNNFIFMLIGIGVILTGFFIMTLDKEEFGFGFLGITLGPIVVFSGFMIELYAILKKKS